MEVYHWTRCSTCRTARERLRERGVVTTERDFFAEPLQRVELTALAARAGGIRNIFSFASPSFRKLGREADSLSDTQLLDLVLEEPRLLRRPLAIDGGTVVTGGRVGEAGRGADPGR